MPQACRPSGPPFRRNQSKCLYPAPASWPIRILHPVEFRRGFTQLHRLLGRHPSGRFPNQFPAAFLEIPLCRDSFMRQRNLALDDLFFLFHIRMAGLGTSGQDGSVPMPAVFFSVRLGASWPWRIGWCEEILRGFSRPDDWRNMERYG